MSLELSDNYSTHGSFGGKREAVNECWCESTRISQFSSLLQPFSSGK